MPLLENVSVSGLRLAHFLWFTAFFSFSSRTISTDEGIRIGHNFQEIVLTIKPFSVSPLLKFSAFFFHPFQVIKETETELFGSNLLEKLEKTIKILQLQYAASPIKSRVINYYTADKGNGTDNSSLPGLSIFASNFSTIDWDQLRRIRQQG